MYFLSILRTKLKNAEELEAKIVGLNSTIEEYQNNLSFMTEKSRSLTEINKELGITVRSKDTELRMLIDRVSELEIVKEDYIKCLAEAKVLKDNYKEQREKLERRLRAEDQMSRMREMADMRQQWLREQSLTKKHEQNELEKAVAKE